MNIYVAVVVYWLVFPAAAVAIACGLVKLWWFFCDRWERRQAGEEGLPGFGSPTGVEGSPPESLREWTHAQVGPFEVHTLKHGDAS